LVERLGHRGDPGGSGAKGLARRSRSGELSQFARVEALAADADRGEAERLQIVVGNPLGYLRHRRCHRCKARAHRREIPAQAGTDQQKRGRLRMDVVRIGKISERVGARYGCQRDGCLWSRPAALRHRSPYSYEISVRIRTNVTLPLARLGWTGSRSPELPSSRPIRTADSRP